MQGLLIQLVKDVSQDVVDLALDSLLPAVMTWTSETELLHTALLPAILSDIRARVERSVWFAAAFCAIAPVAYCCTLLHVPSGLLGSQ